MRQSESATTPVASSERIGELDVLRGFALFGVFTVHFVTSLYYLYPVDESLFSAWTENRFQYTLMILCDVLFLDKAITLFSVLFGIGFWVQMERLKARGAAFERIYLKRLAILLVFGLINKFLLFPGDILVDYALLGFALFFLRGLSARAMLITGVVLMLVVSQLAYGFLDSPWVDEEASEQLLSDALLSESYGAWVTMLTRWHIQDSILGLGILPLGTFVLSRFLIGAWVSRKRLIEKARTAKPLVAKIAAGCIFIGLACEAISMALWEDLLELPEFFDYAVHAIGVPLLALGYACLIILMCGEARWKWLTSLFAPVGRMALTAYIGHGVIILFIAHPFGIYMRPEISPALGWIIAIGVFAGFSLACHFWLKVFSFGPLEWLWRSLTYGRAQAFLKA